VRQHLGRHSRAIRDFENAVNLLTSLIEYAMDEIPEEKRDPYKMKRFQCYLKESKERLLQCRQAADG
jgi:hypothetical protein